MRRQRLARALDERLQLRKLLLCLWLLLRLQKLLQLAQWRRQEALADADLDLDVVLMLLEPLDLL